MRRGRRGGGRGADKAIAIEYCACNGVRACVRACVRVPECVSVWWESVASPRCDTTALGRGDKRGRYRTHYIIILGSVEPASGTVYVTDMSRMGSFEVSRPPKIIIGTGVLVLSHQS